MERRRWRWLQDGALAVALAALGVVEIWLPLESAIGEGPRGPSTAIGIAVALALVLRRRRPLLTVVLVALAWPLAFQVVPLLLLFWGQFVPMVVATYSVARHGRGRTPLYGAAATATGLLVMDLTVPAMGETSEIVFHWSVCAVAWLAGAGLQRHERRAQEASQRAAEIESTARESTLAALAEERADIARELHDIVAHAVSVMVVQAGAAEQMVDDDPEHVRRALVTIRTTGSEALGEMRRMVTVLRSADDGATLAPQPGVTALPELVAAARGAGLAAELEVVGTPREMPAGLDLTVYRIAQEALTNVLRHARASRALVRLTFAADEVELEIHDDGAGPADAAAAVDPDGVGHGLIGMRERATLYGGRLETSAPAGRGFTVRAVLPAAAS